GEVKQLVHGRDVAPARGGRRCAGARAGVQHLGRRRRDRRRQPRGDPRRRQRPPDPGEDGHGHGRELLPVPDRRPVGDGRGRGHRRPHRLAHRARADRGRPRRLLL
ncbi:MAG: hypothetical protein AVDCRST_MAG32-2316, partial [uncultured Nocardioides sp.]